MANEQHDAWIPARTPMSGDDLHDYRARLLLSEILEIMSEFRPLGETLEAIAETVCRRLHFQSCAIMLEQPGTDVLQIQGASGVAAGYIDAINRTHPIHIRDPKLSGGPSSEAIRTLQPVLIEDTETDPRAWRWRELARDNGIRSFITVPLCSRGVAIGAMNCYRSAPGRFDAQEIAALTSVATQSGIAIDIARMVEMQNQSIQRLQELATALEEKHRLLERASQIQDALTELALTNKGVAAIAAILARVTGCPAVIQDRFFNVLAAAGGNENAAVADIMAVAAIDENAVRGITFDTRSPIEISTTSGEGQSIQRALAPILAGIDLFGYVSIALQSVPMPELVRRILEHAATACALEMVKDRLARDAELRVSRGFADDLIVGRFEESEHLQERSRVLGYDLRGPVQVLVFDIDHFDCYVERKGLDVSEIDAIRLKFFDAVENVARAQVPRALVAGRHDQLAMILAGVDDVTERWADTVASAVRRACLATLPELSISIGIGRPYPELSQIRTSHAEARRALRVIRRLGGQSQDTHYAELGVARLLFHVDDPDELLAFARDRLAPLLEYDARHEGILVDTLTAYLAADQSVSRAAEVLAAHPNTVRYRLLKIEELLDASLKDTTVLLDLQLASLVLKIQDPSSSVR